MSVQLAATAFEWNDTFQAHADKIPDICPTCHHAVEPRRIAGCAVQKDRSVVEYVFQCTREACRRFFLGLYLRQGTSGDFRLWSVRPETFQAKSFSDEITSTSAMFVTIYNQALAAETMELDQIAGMGFRKSLEFLIKDFASAEHPTEVDKIKAMFLGQCIKEYVSDPNLKSAAKRAVWLGNDETHYVRKWETKDVRDLKILIQVAVNWIESVLLTRKYEKDMP